MQVISAHRDVQLADIVFAAFLVVYAALSVSLLPYDFTDLCYLFSLEQGRWATQEWVHPIYVPALDLFRTVLGVFGYRARMLIPVELLNVLLLCIALTVLYRLARRFADAALAGAAALAATALTPGFWSAAVRPTPYAPALLCLTLCLSLLVSDRPVSPRRYALAGGLAGLSMGFHASAMGLAVVAVVCAALEPDVGRTPRATLARIVSFGCGMFVVAVGCWGTFIAYRGLGASFFRKQDFWSTFTGIEQVPGTSIYTSGSALAQLTTFAATLSKQGGVLLPVALILFSVALMRRWLSGAPPSALERRLVVAALANFAAIGGFFLINNTHNGFIFASLALMPVLLAVAIRGSWLGLAVLAVVAIPPSVRQATYAVRTNVHGASDPLLAEVRFLDTFLGSRDVLLTPGSPFPELFYLSHVNIIEVSPEASTHPGNEVPVARPGAILRARVAWWLDHGSRVFYALGDESSDFTDDVGGAEKSRQIFWRPETEAAARAPKLQALRASVESSGLDLRDGPRSPNGERYAEVRLRDAPAPAVALPSPTDVVAIDELHALLVSAAKGDAASPYPRRAEFLANYAAVMPGDPWLPCDVMDLVCEGRPRRNGHDISCRFLPGCEATEKPEGNTQVADGNRRGPCFWAPLSDRSVLDAYLGEWSRKHGLGDVSDWGFEAQGESAEMVMVLRGGTLKLNWPLLDTCDAGDVEVTDGSPVAVSADQLRDLVNGLPVPKVRPSKGSAHM